MAVFGKGKDLDAKTWQSVLRQLTAAGFIAVKAEHGGLRLVEEARPVLRGERKITLRRDQTKKQIRAKKAGEMPASAQGLFAQATTMSLVLFLVVAVLAFPVIRVLRKREDVL